MKRPQAVKNDANPSLTPKLRFPEFRDGPGWEAKRLGLTLTFQAGFPFPSSGFNDTGNGPRLIRNRDLRSDDNIVFYSDEFDPGFVVNNGDVLVGMDGDFTPTVWEKGEALLNQRVGRIVAREDNNHRFLLYLLTLCLKGIEQATARTTVKHLSHSAVESKHEPLPPPAEQQRIAECLSTLDELIGAEGQKLDALKAHKNGLMQQLFPRESETLPRLRFPEFQSAPNWEVKEVGAMMSITSSKRVHESQWSDEGVPFYRARELVALKKGEAITPLNISEELYRTNIGLSGEIRAGHLLVTGVGSIGVPYLVGADDRFYFKDGNIIWLKNDEAELIGSLLLRLYESALVQDQIREMADVGTVATYTIDNAKKTRVAYPRNKSEQYRIASCLSSLDDLIAAQSDKLDMLKTLKKGLMQQLFPSPVESEA